VNQVGGSNSAALRPGRLRSVPVELHPYSWELTVMHLAKEILGTVGQSRGMSPVRLLLIDDHLMITEALASWLSAAPDIWVAGRCATADPSLPDIVRGARPNVITIEVEPLGPAIGEVLQRLVAAQPKAHVVVLSSDRALAHAVEAAQAGVSAWVAKDQDAAELESVIRGVMQGKSWFPPEMLGETLRQLRGDVCRAKEHNDLLGLLTSREREVLLRMMEGKRGRQIGPGSDDLALHGANPHR
jgi:two-component system, NarL family, response regulator LiaR